MLEAMQMLVTAIVTMTLGIVYIVALIAAVIGAIMVLGILGK